MTTKTPPERLRRSAGLFWLLVAAAVASCGCTAPPLAQTARPAPRERVPIALRRVAIVEFRDRSPYSGTAEMFSNLLKQELADQTVGADFTVIPRSALPDMEDPFDGGKIPLQVLVRVRKAYLADGLIVGCVDDHNPYFKPFVNLSLKVVDTASGATRCELSQGWDAARQDVYSRIEQYYRRNYGRDDCRFGPELFVISPRHFLKFVADQVAEEVIVAL